MKTHRISGQDTHCCSGSSETHALPAGAAGAAGAAPSVEGMPTMSPPLQTAHMNVLDVLAPLFCNGRSFSSLIDELSRHFKFEPMSLPGYANTAGYDGATGELEGSSESQSTDSEAEVRS